MIEKINWGPLDSLLQDASINEILVNSYSRIFFEREGFLFQSEKSFLNEKEYKQLIEKILEKCSRDLNREKPFLEVRLDGLRVTAVYSEITSESTILSLRKTRCIDFTTDFLRNNFWAEKEAIDFLEFAVHSKKNILIVGATASGKTAVLQALINSLKANERLVILEDTQELTIPNKFSLKLISREEASEQIGPITLERLIKHSLRLKPDRLAVGEVRSAEAYSLLLALSTGHQGSFSTLHAADSRQALIRLEMLVQLGAPQWDLYSIRRLIALTIDLIVVVEKKESRRRLKEICSLRSVEANQITTEKLY